MPSPCFWHRGGAVAPRSSKLRPRRWTTPHGRHRTRRVSLRVPGRWPVVVSSGGKQVRHPVLRQGHVPVVGDTLQLPLSVPRCGTWASTYCSGLARG